MTSVSAHAESSRAVNEPRPISIKAGNVLGQSNGSATFSYGHESALSSITGPTEVRIRDELTDRSTLQITFLPLDGSAGITSSSFSTTLVSTLSSLLLLHLYPRSLIQVTLQSTNHPTIGTLPLRMPLASLKRHQLRRRQATIRPSTPHPDAELAASQRASLVNAAMLGLVAAGIQAKATLCAVAVAVIPAEVAKYTRGYIADDDDASVPVLDPSPLEESVAFSTHVLGFAVFGTEIDTSAVGVDAVDSTAEAKLALVQSSGKVQWDVYAECIRMARDSAREVRGEMRAALGRRYSQQGATV